ncbi:MAG TPA: ABC transporter permease subunit [Herpetosiphonaceae bacterium]
MTQHAETGRPGGARRFSWQANPVVVKELRSRMRGGRAFVLLTGFLVGLGAVGFGLFQLATSRERFGMPLFSAQIGQTLFGGLAFALLGLVCIIAPAVTVNAISSERERLTYEMLVATPLPAWRLLWGKLVAALSYVALLLLAAVPLGSIVYLFGGITLKVVLQVAAVIVMTAVTAGMLGVWASALTGKTGRAAVVSYLILALTLGGLLFFAQIWQARNSKDVPWEALTPNPISALASAVATLVGPQVADSGMVMRGGVGLAQPDVAIFQPMPMPFPGDGQIVDGGFYMPGWRTLSVGLYPVANPNGQPQVVEPRQVWRTNLQIQLMVCLGLFWMSLHLVRPRRRWRLGWGDLAMLSITATAMLGIGVWRQWWF